MVGIELGKETIRPAALKPKRHDREKILDFHGIVASSPSIGSFVWNLMSDQGWWKMPQYEERLSNTSRQSGSERNLSLIDAYRSKHQHPLNRLTHMIGIPMLFFSVLYPLFAWFAWGQVEWQALLILGALGWGLQFLGHAIEGNRPAFMEDPRHFFVGPLVILYKPFARMFSRRGD